MKPSSAIKKGRLLEEWLVSQLREKGIDERAYRSHGSGNGNGEKSDCWTSAMVLGQNIGFECKNQATIKIPEWWKQVRKLESLGREPVLVFKIAHAPLGDSLATIYLDTFLDMVKENRELKIKIKEYEQIGK